MAKLKKMLGCKVGPYRVQWCLKGWKWLKFQFNDWYLEVRFGCGTLSFLVSNLSQTCWKSLTFQPFRMRIWSSNFNHFFGGKQIEDRAT